MSKLRGDNLSKAVQQDLGKPGVNLRLLESNIGQPVDSETKLQPEV